VSDNTWTSGIEVTNFGTAFQLDLQTPQARVWMSGEGGVAGYDVNWSTQYKIIDHIVRLVTGGSESDESTIMYMRQAMITKYPDIECSPDTPSTNLHTICLHVNAVAASRSGTLFLAVEHQVEQIFAFNAAGEIINQAPLPCPNVDGGFESGFVLLWSVTNVQTESKEPVHGWGITGAEGDKMLIGGSFDTYYVYWTETNMFERVLCSAREHTPGSGGFMASVVHPKDDGTVYLSRYVGETAPYEIWVYDTRARTCRRPDWNRRLAPKLKQTRAMGISPDGLFLLVADRLKFNSDLFETFQVRMISTQTGEDHLFTTSTPTGPVPLPFTNVVDVGMREGDPSIYVLGLLNAWTQQPFEWAVHKIDSLSLTIDDATMAHNEATRDGGGLSLESLRFLRSAHMGGLHAQDNVAGRYGGGVSMSRVFTEVPLEGARLERNSASVGGGLSARGCSSLLVRDGVVSHNHASASAPGAHVSSVTDDVGVVPGGDIGRTALAVEDSTLEYNSTPLGAGGGLSLKGSVEGVVSGALIAHNDAEFGGNVATAGAVRLTIHDSDLLLATAHACGGGLSINSTYPVTLGGRVRITNNLAMGDGGGVCALLRDEMTLRCGARASPRFFLLDVPDAASDVRISGNVARGGGGAAFARCLQHPFATGEAQAPANASAPPLMWLPLGDERLRVFGNDAAYGPHYAGIAERMRDVQEGGEDTGAYRPGAPLRTKLLLEDAWGHTLRHTGAVLPYRVDVRITDPSAPPAVQQVYRGDFAFGEDGVCDLAAAEGPVPWPSVGGVMRRTFTQSLDITHEIQGLVGDVRMNSVDILVERLPCEPGQSFDQASRMCKNCFPSQYVLFPDQSRCEDCPPSGSICNGANLTSNVEGAVWVADASTGLMKLASCPAGNQLVNSSDGDSTGLFSQSNQHCKPCLPGTQYIIDPNKHTCQTCPVGAECDGSNLVGKDGSEWEADRVNYRLVGCQPGFVLVRNQEPSFDQCIECPVNYYLIDPARWRPRSNEPDLVATNGVEALQRCFPCELGADCRGADRIIQQPGFWFLGDDAMEAQPTARRYTGTAAAAHSPRTQFLHPDAHGHNVRRQATSAFKNATRVTVYQCPSNACLGNGTCANGRRGPVCGLCVADWVMVMNTCIECSNADTETAAAVALAVTITIVVLVWGKVSWWPLIGGLKVEQKKGGPGKTTLDKLARRFGYVQPDVRSMAFGSFPQGGGGYGSMPKATNVGSLNRRASIVQRNKPTKVQTIVNGVRLMSKKETIRAFVGYVKIIVGFYQILSTFPVTFTRLEWGEQNEETMEVSQWSRLDLLSIPDIVCLMSGYKFYDRLLVYVVTPIIVSVMLIIPSIVVSVLGKLHHGGWTKHPKHRQVMAAYFWSQSFWLFLIYPTVSVAALRGIHCRLVGDQWLLTADLSEPCPILDKSGAIFQLAVLAIVLYPVGVPVILTAVLYSQGVPRMAQKKADKALLRALINLYKQKTSTADAELLSRYLGTTTKSSEQKDGEVALLVRSATFRRRVDALYQAEFGDAEQKAVAAGAAGVAKGMNLKRLMGLDGDESQEEFEAKMEQVVREHHMFTGYEDPTTLSLDQCMVLLKHFKAIAEEDEAEDDELGAVRSLVLIKARSLERAGKLSMPLLVWDESDGEEERKMIRRVGNLFISYKVQFWYYDLLNTVHKLLMTSVLVFLFEGEYVQFAAGIAVIYVFLLTTMRQQPYVVAALSNLQIYSLIVLVITLFFGMMKSINDWMVTAKTNSFINGAPFSVFVLIIVATVPLMPLFFELATSAMHRMSCFKRDKELSQMRAFDQEHRPGAKSHQSHRTLEEAPAANPPPRELSTPPSFTAPPPFEMSTDPLPQHAPLAGAPVPAPYTAQVPLLDHASQWNSNGHLNGNGNGAVINGAAMAMPVVNPQHTLGKLKPLPKNKVVPT